MPDEVNGGGDDDQQRHVETMIKSDDHGDPLSLKSGVHESPVLAALSPAKPSTRPGLNVSVSVNAVSDPVIGSTVNGYVVRGKLGAGGMGIVYSGDHPVIGKRAAIKVLRPEIAENEEQVKRLVSEARAVNAVGHRGIVDVFGYDTLPDGRQCIVMEYLDGEPLSDMLSRNRKEKRVMPIPQVMVVLEEILSALGAAHSAGVIHRDLKPSNIFLCKQRDGMSYVKLLDFGIAKLGVLGGPQQTKASMLVGTPSYMAPEQARGGVVGPGMDLYAVGIIAFEMLTGELPFNGESVVEVLMKHAEEPPPKPSSLLMSIPDDLDELVTKLLAKEPQDRYQSADEVREFGTRIRKSLSESTARSIGLSIGRSIPKSGPHHAVTPASVPIEPVSHASPLPQPLPKPPLPPAETIARDSVTTSEVVKPVAKKLPPEMVAATMAVPESARPKPPASTGSSRGLVLGVVGLILGLAALGIAYLNKQPQVVVVPPPAPEVRVEPRPEPPKEPEVKVVAPEPEPKVEPPPPEPVKEVVKQPAPPPLKKEPVKAAAKPAAPKGDKLLARFLALEKAAEANPEALAAVDRTILGKYLHALKEGTIKPEQRDQAELFANKIQADLR